VAANLEQMTGVIRQHTKLPIAVGFGISNPEQARQVAACSDAIVVGSAIVNQIAEHGAEADLPERVGSFVKTLVDAIREK